MKTTIELPDALAEDAKSVARSTRTTLRELVIAGLRSELERRRAVTAVDFAFPTFDGDGLVAGLAPTDMIARSYGLPA